MSTIEQKADAAVRKINVVVVYNGLTRNFAFEPHMTITAGPRTRDERIRHHWSAPPYGVLP